MTEIKTEEWNRLNDWFRALPASERRDLINEAFPMRAEIISFNATTLRFLKRLYETK